MNRDIKKIALHLIKKYNTQNPFKIADALKIEYIIGPMGHYSGCYLYLKKHRCIFLNDELSENEKSFVMAHELNTFAAELLIPDSLIYENPGMTKSQLARLAGYNEKIMEFKKVG